MGSAKRLEERTAHFFKRAHGEHGDKYDYSMVDYTNNYTKIKIICPVHGLWEQKPSNHLTGRGCPKCRYLGRDVILKRLYDNIPAGLVVTDDSDVENLDSNVRIHCPVHGEYTTCVNNPCKGHGCPKCKISIQPKGLKRFLEEVKLVHGDTYTYNKFKYINTHTKSIITCKRHGDFLQSPDKHLLGRGCPKCARENQIIYHSTKIDLELDKLKSTKGYLYFIKLEGYPNCYKIGVSANIRKRMMDLSNASGGEIVKVNLLEQDMLSNITMENHLHSLFSNLRYRDLDFSGYTECFYLSDEDVLRVSTFIDRMKSLIKEERRANEP